MSWALEMAIIHLAGTLADGKPVYIDDPDDPPATHKRAQRAS